MSLRNQFALALILLLAACSKEDLATWVVNDETTLMALVMGEEHGKGEKGEEKNENDCFTLVYPITLTMPDGTSLTGADHDDLWDAVKDWYDAHPDSDQRPAFVFPVEVVFYDGTLQTVNDQEEMGALWENCEGAKRPCYKFVLPVSVTMPDGTIISINAEEDWQQVRSWYETHPDVTEKFTFAFPLEVIFKDGEIKTIENSEGLRRLEAACSDQIACFEYVLPISLTLPDGTSVTINEDQDWLVVKDWYETHPDVAQRPILDFPLEVTFYDGQTLLVNSQDALENLAADCYEEKDCFNFVLPVSWTMPDATTITVTTEDEWQLLRDWYAVHPDVAEEPALQYPVEVALEDGTVQAVDNEAAMQALKDDCEE